MPRVLQLKKTNIEQYIAFTEKFRSVIHCWTAARLCYTWCNLWNSRISNFSKNVRGVPAKLLLKFPKNSISRLQISPCNTFRASSKKAVHHRFWIDFFPSWFSSCVVPFRTERCKNSHFPDDGLVTRACQSNYFVCSHRELKLMAEQVLRCREDQSKCDLLEYSNNFAFNGFSDVLNFYEIIFPFFVYLMSHLTQCWMRQFWYCGLIVAHIILKCFLFFIEGWPAQRNIPPSYPPGNIANHNILLDLRKGWAGLDQICK